MSPNRRLILVQTGCAGRDKVNFVREMRREPKTVADCYKYADQSTEEPEEVPLPVRVWEREVLEKQVWAEAIRQLAKFGKNK